MKTVLSELFLGVSILALPAVAAAESYHFEGTFRGNGGNANGWSDIFVDDPGDPYYGQWCGYRYLSASISDSWNRQAGEGHPTSTRGAAVYYEVYDWCHGFYDWGGAFVPDVGTIGRNLSGASASGQFDQEKCTWACVPVECPPYECPPEEPECPPPPPECYDCTPTCTTETISFDIALTGVGDTYRGSFLYVENQPGYRNRYRSAGSWREANASIVVTTPTAEYDLGAYGFSGGNLYSSNSGSVYMYRD